MTKKEIEKYLKKNCNHYGDDYEDIMGLINDTGIKVSERGLKALLEAWKKGYKVGYDEAY